MCLIFVCFSFKFLEQVSKLEWVERNILSNVGNASQGSKRKARKKLSKNWSLWHNLSLCFSLKMLSFSAPILQTQNSFLQSEWETTVWMQMYSWHRPKLTEGHPSMYPFRERTILRALIFCSLLKRSLSTLRKSWKRISTFTFYTSFVLP